MFGQNRHTLRRLFLDAWQKRRQGEPLDALQSIIADTVEQHPEYHALLDSDTSLERDFSAESGESNPFLHLSMHIALHEQLSTDRPAGIRDCHRRLCRQYADPHTAEHAMMECLGEVLWQAQRSQAAPDETAYLHCLQRLLRKS